MKALEAVEALARIARRETPPETDVRIGDLLRDVRREARWRLGPWAWSAAVSAVAAGIVLTVALHGNNSNSSASVDSITPLFNAAQVQMP